ncbi:MAG TPA: flavodoxin [Candidatus Bathyarchaeia archaeon]|nr:flavodoxin [Candidatus Bathyarchaeia archaeon]
MGCKSLIICASFHHKNTEKIAGVIGKELGAKIISTHEFRPRMARFYNLIGFGSGIYFKKHHQKIFDLVRKIPRDQDKRAFIFSTSGLPRIYLLNDFHKPLRRLLRLRGYKIVAEFSCLGWDTYGLLRFIGGINRSRPNKKDFGKAAAFAQKLSKILK